MTVITLLSDILLFNNQHAYVYFRRQVTRGNKHARTPGNAITSINLNTSRMNPESNDNLPNYINICDQNKTAQSRPESFPEGEKTAANSLFYTAYSSV